MNNSQPPKQPQQIQLNPFQVIQVAAGALAQLQAWIEAKQGTPDDSHPSRTVDAKRSIVHTRLLLNVKYQELMREMIAAQKAPPPPLKPFEPKFVDTESSKLMFEKVKTQQGC